MPRHLVWSLAIALGFAGCHTQPQQLPDALAWQRAHYTRILDELGEPPPGVDSVTLRFLWAPSFHDMSVFTVGVDGDTPWLRSRRRDARTGQWHSPQLVFVTRADYDELWRGAHQRDWRDPGLVGDGSAWVFAGMGSGGWSAYRHSPGWTDEWCLRGRRLVELAQRDDLRVEQLH